MPPSEGASLRAQLVKNLPAVQEVRVQSLGWGDPLEQGKATHSSGYSCLENPMDRGAWQDSPWGRKESDTTERLNLHHLLKAALRVPSYG